MKLTFSKPIWCLTLFIMLIATSCTAQKKGKWIQLFNGKDFSGWHKFGGGDVGSAWKVDNGVMYLDTIGKEGWKTKDGGDIVTDAVFEDFHLQLEWKIAKNGNSGIMFYVQEGPGYPNAYETGPEMQVLDNDGHPDGKIKTHRAGDLYDLISCSRETVKKPGQWNQAEIIAHKGALTFILNGEKVVQTTMWDEGWKQMIANSKFKQWPGFGAFQSGKICLQDHGDMVWYRNIRIKKL